MSAAITENTFMTEVCGILQENGFEGVSRCVEILVNEAMRIERSRVGVKPIKQKQENQENSAEKQSRHWYDIVIKLTGKDPTICPVCKIGRMKMYREIFATSPPLLAVVKAA